MGLVYWIYCNQTYKSYIGSTIQKIDERIKRHHRQIDCSSKQILDGGTLHFVMGPEPNKNWGTITNKAQE